MDPRDPQHGGIYISGFVKGGKPIILGEFSMTTPEVKVPKVREKEECCIVLLVPDTVLCIQCIIVVPWAVYILHVHVRVYGY